MIFIAIYMLPWQQKEILAATFKVFKMLELYTSIVITSRIIRLPYLSALIPYSALLLISHCMPLYLRITPYIPTQ